MKKLILTLALVFVLVFSFVACNSEGDGGALQQGEFSLTLATNIEAAGVASGGGYYDYNDDVCIEVTVNSGYYFLGWYHNTDLISTSPVYNCKMWDQSITLEAKFTAIPEDQIGSGSAGPGMGDINREYTLTVQSNTPKLGLVNVDDVGLTEKHTALSTSGKNIKALALTISSKRFLGWFDSAGNLVMANAVFNLVMPNFDYALTAMWQCDELPNAQNTSEAYLKNAATCETRAEYYYSCSICGEKGTDTFFVGEKLPHTYNQKNTDSTYVKQYACTRSSEYYYSCVCGAKGTKTFLDPATGHSWNSENTCSVCGEYKDSSLKFVINGDNTYGVSDYTGNGTHVVIPSTYKGLKVTSIGSFAFRNCSSLTSIVIPDSVTSIGDYAFRNCSSLTSVTIGSGVTSIGDYAFYSCSNLNAVYISDLAAWCGISFGSSYANPLYYGENLYLNGALVTDLVIPDSVTSISSYAFRNCDCLTSIVIPDSVTSIGYDAFSGCSNLTSVTIPDSVTSIGSYAFSSCSNLTSVTIGSGVTSIGYDAFYDCDHLTSIVFKDTTMWFRVQYYVDWNDKTGGTAISVTNASTNATNFKSTYYDYYWYKL